MHQVLVLTTQGITSGMVYAAVALALVLIWRSTRSVIFAQGGRAMFTTYMALWVSQASGSYWLGFVVALGSGLVAGAVVERVVIRRIAAGPPLNPVIASLGILLFLEAVVPMIFGGQIPGFPPGLCFFGFKVAGVDMPFSPLALFTFARVRAPLALLHPFFRFHPPAPTRPT